MAKNDYQLLVDEDMKDLSYLKKVEKQENADDNNGDDMLLIDKTVGYKTCSKRELIYWLIIIFSGGSALLIFYWFELLKINIRYLKAKTSEATHILVFSTQDSKFEFCQVNKIETSNEKYIVYRFSRFFFNQTTQDYEKVKLNNQHEKSKLLKLVKHGLNGNELVYLGQRFGKNEINFPIKSIPKLLMEEVLHPFFIFQIYSVGLWFAEAYYYYAVAILLIALVSACLSLKEIRSNLISLQKIAHFTCEISVLKNNGMIETVSSTELVPGDIIELKQNSIMPCDVILLTGQAILNESMLTGESIPVTKYSVLTDDDFKLQNDPQNFEDEVKDLSKEKRSLVYGGTLVVKLMTQPASSSDKIYGMVRDTSFQTTKGKLILSILYPKESHFKFFRESLKFVGVLCFLALIGFSLSVWKLYTLGVDIPTIALRALDLITIVIPPALPMAMTVGTGFGLSRLKKSKVFCISPPRLNMAGKIQVFCFDKTGTLTEEGLDLLGILPTTLVTSNNNEAIRFIQMCDPNQTSFSSGQFLFRLLMASCHSLSVINGSLSGDPLEIKIFEATQSSILDSSDTGGSGQRIYISSTKFQPQDCTVDYLENFDFQSKLQRMSVIVQLQSDGSCFSLVKGSPEMIKNLCLSQTIPQDYDSQLAIYTEKGYRVLACAYRQWDPTVSYPKRDVLRKESESNLQFLGFIIMENRVKPQSPPTIETLQKANIRTVMVTGDNGLTATSVAKQCGIIKPHSILFMGLVDGDNIVWEHVSQETKGYIHNLDPTLLSLDDDSRDYNLIVTGPVFKQIYNHYLATGSKRFVNMLRRGIVYARMTPDEKQILVEELERIGLYVGMCGDGANDCGALKAAHVGISLSESEASIAAPFTSTVTDITCCPTLIKEGRASLAVSFKLFQFMGMYSLIQFTSVIFLYFQASVLGNWQYLYQDLFVIFPLVVFLGMTKPSNKLSVKRPSGRLISVSIVGSLFAHIIVCVAFEAIVYILVQSRSWYTNEQIDEENIFTYITTSLFIYGSFLYSIMLLTFSFGKPFLKQLYTNKYLFGVYLFTLGTNLFLLLGGIKPIWDFLQLLVLPVSWRLTMLGLIAVNLIFNVLVEFAFYTFKSRSKKKKVINVTKIFNKKDDEIPKDDRIYGNSVSLSIH